MVFGRVRERARERREELRESEREQGGGVASSGASSEEGRAGRQASRWRGAVAVRARRPHAWPTGARRTTAVVGWAGLLGQRRLVRSPGKFPSFLFFCFLIF